MGSKMQKVGLVVTGAVIGVLISLNFSAIADKPAPTAAAGRRAAHVQRNFRPGSRATTSSQSKTKNS